MQKKYYLILYTISFIIYIVYIPYSAYIVNNNVSFHTAYLADIAKNQPGRTVSYNIFLLANEDYRLSRSKNVIGSVLSYKEVSQFDIEKINTRPKINYESDSFRLISFYLAKPHGKSISRTPIGLRKGSSNEKDGWYYFTLLGYVLTDNNIPLVLLTIQLVLAAKCFKLYIDESNNKGVIILNCISFFFLLLACLVF